jgi:hypothetical protein
MSPRTLRLLALGALALLVGCARCGAGCGGADTSAAPGVEPLARQVPRAADAVVLVPDLGRLGERVLQLQGLELVDFVSPLAGARNGKALVDGLVRQAGLDPRSRAELEKAGLDPARGMAVVLLPGDAVYSVLPVRDEAALRETAARLARQLAGAGSAATESAGGLSLTRFAPAEGAPPRLVLAVRGPWAFVAAGAAMDRLAQLAALPPEQALAGEPLFTDGRRRLGGEPELLGFLPGASRFLAGRGLPGLTLAASLGLTGVTVRADAPAGERADLLRALTPQAGAPALSGYLPPDAFLVARFAGDPAGLERAWPSLVGPFFARAAQQTGFDFKGEVLDNLQPGLAAGVSLSPTARMTGVPGGLSMRRTNPFIWAHLTAVGELKDAARGTATLGRVPALAEKFAATMTPEERGGQQVYLTRYAAGEGAHLALAGSRLLVAAPESRLLEGLERLKGAAGPAPLPAQLLSSLEGKGVAVVVDLHKLADGVRALPSEAWGIGGFALKPTTVRWLDAFRELTHVTAHATASEGALQAEVSLALKARGAGGAAR